MTPTNRAEDLEAKNTSNTIVGGKDEGNASKSGVNCDKELDREIHNIIWHTLSQIPEYNHPKMRIYLTKTCNCARYDPLRQSSTSSAARSSRTVVIFPCS